MLTDLIAERITPENHSLARERLEVAGYSLRSVSPPELLDPRRFVGIRALEVALSNLQAQSKIEMILVKVDAKKEKTMTEQFITVRLNKNTALGGEVSNPGNWEASAFQRRDLS